MPQSNIKDSILVRMLSRLSKKQQKGFQAYLACSIFNTNPTLENLCRFLLAKALKAPEKPLMESAMVRELSISPKIVDKLFSQLLQHLNRFVHLWRNRDNPRAEYAETFRFWLEQELEPELLEREYRKMKRKIEAEPTSDADLWHLLQLEHQYSVYQTFQPRKDQGSLFEAHHNLLDHYYWVTKLKYLCASINVAHIFRRPPSHADFDLDPQVLAGLPSIGQAYYSACQLLQAGATDPAEAEAFFILLEKNGDGFAREDRLNLYGFLLNTCFRAMRLGYPHFEYLALDAYDATLRADILIQNGKISAAHFKNIVSLMSRLRTVEETSNFVQSYERYLPAPDRQELLSYCHGLIAFCEGSFRDAMVRFREIVQGSPEDLFWGLEARNMLWKTYFEVGEELNFEEKEEMLRLYDSFRLYVSRNSRISEYNKTCYENFIRIFNQLIRTDDRGRWASTKAEYETILSQARSSPALMNKGWLVDVIQRKIHAFH